ncbi:hypothetical protein TIFTF001_002380 [Ficus carica]|uniref:BHLH domain-containing protein n=1 Tax=Ficus carica TaxID=3494 RepID=A0AA87ZD09_FICCA|nr:hypothetical protein TIFTF001_002380 [Ficus carica]
MEYENLHSQHHQLQEQVNIGVQSAPLPIIAPSTLVTTTSNYCNWNPSLILNSEANIPNSRLWQYSPTTTFTSHHDHHDFNYGDGHARSSAVFSTRRSGANESPLQNIKEEPNSDSFSKLKIANIMGLMSNSSYTSSAPGQLYDSNASFGHVFPSTTRSTVSTGSLFPSLVLSSGGFNSTNSHDQALDLLSPTGNYSTDGSLSTTYNSPSSQHSNNSSISGLVYRSSEPIMSVGHGHHDMQDQSRSSPSNTSNKMASADFFKEVTRTKRPATSFSEPKESHAEATATNKKSKSISRSSNPPLKVRKEKLGDRIAALHRLVAPFGKTDTASVLTEAIGYILFLHDQVQVHGLSKEKETELKMDLRSRGLCLVPHSCASYLNGFE